VTSKEEVCTSHFSADALQRYACIYIVSSGRQPNCIHGPLFWSASTFMCRFCALNVGHYHLRFHVGG